LELFGFCGVALIGFPGVLGFDKCFQVGEVHLPEVAVLIEPCVHRPQGFWIEVVNAVAAFAVLPHQVGAAEQAQVLGDGGTRDGKSSGDFSGGLAAAPQEVEDGAAGGVGERLEGGLG